MAAPTAPVPTTRYEMTLVGKPTTHAATAKALANGGPLLIAPDHVLATMLPDALDRVSHAPQVVINTADMHGTFVGGMLFEPAITAQGMHLSVVDRRWTVLLQELDNAGCDFEPVSGDMKTAWPTVAIKMTAAVKTLPRDKRAIVKADVFYDKDPDNAATDSWFDWITPAALMSGDGGPEVLAQFMQCFPNAMYAGSDYGREGDSFSACIEQVLASVGRDVSSLTHRAQAAAVAAWFKRTCPPPLLIPWIEEPMDEVERRAAALPSARYEPVFKIGWTRIPQLRKLWPGDVEDIVSDTSAFATSMGVAGLEHGLTAQAVKALLTAMQDYGSFAIASDNATRTAEVVRAYKRVDSDKTGELSSEAKAQLQADAGFQQFKTEVEVINIEMHVEIAKATLATQHGAGLLFLNGKLTHDKFWKERAGARTESTIQAVFDCAVSYTTAGVAAEWGSVLPTGTAKKILAGTFTLDWWEALKPVVSKREGKIAADKISARLKGKPAKAVFSDSEAMRLLEKPARACMDLIMPGKDGSSFGAIWQAVTRMASTIENLPDSCLPKAGLRKRLQDAAWQSMRCPQDRYEAMLAMPANAIRRVASFAVDGQALNAINSVAGHVDRIKQEVEDGMHGYAKDLNNNQYGDGYDGQQWSSRQWGDQWGDDEQVSKRQKAEREHGGWGSATHLGIAANATGTKLQFGTRITTFDEAPDLAKNCVACFATGGGRDKWCPTPLKCWKAGGGNAHARVDGFTDTDCQSASATAANVSGPSEMTKTIVKPFGGSEPARKGGGKGNGDGGGKGKGKGKGKGGGKGGGKGKGKGGNSHFARQSRY
jgi:hypothetical protein